MFDIAVDGPIAFGNRCSHANVSTAVIVRLLGRSAAKRGSIEPRNVPHPHAAADTCDRNWRRDKMLDVAATLPGLASAPLS